MSEADNEITEYGSVPELVSTFSFKEFESEQIGPKDVDLTGEHVKYGGPCVTETKIKVSESKQFNRISTLLGSLNKDNFRRRAYNSSPSKEGDDEYADYPTVDSHFGTAMIGGRYIIRFENVRSDSNIVKIFIRVIQLNDEYVDKIQLDTLSTFVSNTIPQETANMIDTSKTVIYHLTLERFEELVKIKLPVYPKTEEDEV